jgi:hypothetical protein
MLILAFLPPGTPPRLARRSSPLLGVRNKPTSFSHFAENPGPGHFFAEASQQTFRGLARSQFNFCHTLLYPPWLKIM